MNTKSQRKFYKEIPIEKISKGDIFIIVDWEGPEEASTGNFQGEYEATKDAFWDSRIDKNNMIVECELILTTRPD